MSTNTDPICAYCGFYMAQHTESQAILHNAKLLIQQEEEEKFYRLKRTPEKLDCLIEAVRKA